MADRFRSLSECFHDRVADLVHQRFGRGFKTQNEGGLSVGRANESPAVTEVYANSVDVVDGAAGAGEDFLRFFDELELLVFLAIDADLWSGDRARKVGEE